MECSKPQLTLGLRVILKKGLDAYKRKWWLVSVLFALLLVVNYITETVPSLISFVTTPESDFSVLCYNVRCSDEAYQTNQIGIANELLAKLPDIIFLCEFNRSVSKRLDSIMIKQGGYKSFYRSGANCIFYSKYDIDSIAGIDTGTSNGKKALNNMVHVITPKGIVSIVGCHLSSSRKNLWDGRMNRKREADSIYQIIVDEERPAIVMGDLNDLSCSRPVKRIEEAGLKDAWWEGGYGYGATYHDGWLRLRVDHILYDSKGLELVDVKVIDNDLSDHNALMAKFKIIKKE